METSRTSAGAIASNNTAGASRKRWRDDHLQVLDVRREAEWHAGHIEGAAWWPLDNYSKFPRLKLTRLLHWLSIARADIAAMIACSLLLRAGVTVINVAGGFDAWRQAGLPVELEITEKV